ncbi:MAG: hypothetical protein ASARMPREDX12_001557 [Alectoria sarmentosa]|nr:MAG: hypothetical protein ASARMPRED_001679 [Alectoria sarmentosa]CAD6584216.1 MAG: hypothetical protein ASARMPREDX12_001557 [Alectoria sarmentosa]
MASTDSTIPDTSTGDSAGGQAGQGFTDKAKSVLKGNIPTVDKGTEQSAEKDVKERMDQGVGKDTGSSVSQNTLL